MRKKRHSYFPLSEDKTEESGMSPGTETGVGTVTMKKAEPNLEAWNQSPNTTMFFISPGQYGLSPQYYVYLFLFITGLVGA